LTFGSKLVSVPVVALKLNTLFRVSVTAGVGFTCLMDVNLPTAYMLPPQGTSFRMISVLPSVLGVAMLGVYAAGVGCTEPVPVAVAEPATPAVVSAAAATAAVDSLLSVVRIGGGLWV
jgi:hypothetical protein